MSKQLDKSEVIIHKKEAIKSLNALLEKYINSGDYSLLKKADLIAYWFETFSNYIDFEARFDSSRLIRYSRGDVIRVNFGFNIGKEMGGLHFAVVLDNDNKQNADVITVLPLSSTDGKAVHPRSVDLGMELFEKISSVQENLLRNLRSEQQEMEKINVALHSTISAIEQSDGTNGTIDTQNIAHAVELQNEILQRIYALEATIERAENNKKEISKLKLGSMAVTNQITTISKQRIYTPKKSEDFLYGISLSTNAMEKINAKILELYTRKPIA